MTSWVVLNACSRVRHVLCFMHLKPVLQAPMKQKGANPKEVSLQIGPMGWRRSGCWMNWAAASLWLEQQTHQQSTVFITAGSAGNTCLWRHMGCTRPCALTREPITFQEINVFIWKLQVGGDWFWRQSHEKGRRRAVGGINLERSTSDEG